MAHCLDAGASLEDAVKLLAKIYAPHIALVDAQGLIKGIVSEEAIRLGLSQEARLSHPLSSLAKANEGQIPSDEQGHALPFAPTPPPIISRALLMAGGLGSRLKPLTETCPKPLLPIAGKAVLHHILEQVKAAGIDRCWVSVHYLADQIQDSLGDGSAFGQSIEYLTEKEPLGTAGALGLLPRSSEPLLVMNGDIHTDLNLPAFFAWHARHENKVTVATHLFEVDVPYGLAHSNGQDLRFLEEKPTLRLPVNAGIYLFAAEIVNQLARGEPHDMVDWINRLAGEGLVGQFPIVEQWYDIGSLEEYRRVSGMGEAEGSES